MKRRDVPRRRLNGTFLPMIWSAEEEEKFSTLYPITSAKELARIFGMAEMTIYDRARQRGLKRLPDRSGRAVPAGTVSIDVKGYRVIKLGPRNWERLHTVLWREAHGEIPQGHRVRFKDRDKQNCVLENLELVSNEEHMQTYTIANYPKPIKQAMITLAKLRKTIHAKQN